LAAVLINSAIAYRGADGAKHFMSDHSLFVTFWTASAIMIVALLLAIYYSRSRKANYTNVETVEAV
jgi:uncharacterized membrane protein